MTASMGFYQHQIFFLEEIPNSLKVGQDKTRKLRNKKKSCNGLVKMSSWNSWSINKISFKFDLTHVKKSKFILLEYKVTFSKGTQSKFDIEHQNSAHFYSRSKYFEQLWCNINKNLVLNTFLRSKILHCIIGEAPNINHLPISFLSAFWFRQICKIASMTRFER